MEVAGPVSAGLQNNGGAEAFNETVQRELGWARATPPQTSSDSRCFNPYSMATTLPASQCHGQPPASGAR
jgi:hypothetical protein